MSRAEPLLPGGCVSLMKAGVRQSGPTEERCWQTGGRGVQGQERGLFIASCPVRFWECQGSLEVSSGGSGSGGPDVGDWSGANSGVECQDQTDVKLTSKLRHKPDSGLVVFVGDD